MPMTLRRQLSSSPAPATKWEAGQGAGGRARTAILSRLGVVIALLSVGRPAVASGDAGPATASRPNRAGEFSLFDRVIGATWKVSANRFKPIRLADRKASKTYLLSADAFDLTLSDGTVLRSSEMRVVAGPQFRALKGDPNASRLSERLNGKQVELTLEDAARKVRADWRGVLRDGSHYVRQEVTLLAEGEDLALKEICLVDIDLSDARVVGTVKGSPVVAGDLFLGFEHPLSESQVAGGHVRCVLARALPLKSGQTLTLSSVIGTAAPGQMRRDFAAYVERERAHPYRPFLHYNTWYDLRRAGPRRASGAAAGSGNYDAATAMATLNAFTLELHQKRGVTLSSFLFDDGWDNPQTLWSVSSAFPNGFAPLRDAARNEGANVGFWLSPWGGYGGNKDERIHYGSQEGFETNEGGFALSGPVYYKRFRDVCLQMIHENRANLFKFDGTGNVNSVIPGSEFGSDFEAMIHLVGELRKARPDLFVNLTTGTWPSPFWLWFVDSTWRGGADHSFTGVGSNRQRWITYRDAATYHNVVQRSPLYPINSLMLHGLIYARYAYRLNSDPGNDFADEVHSYFGTGTQLQEMYISPELLSAQDWDTLAEAARWSQRNADVLVDTHWVGGDPGKLEVYGWAAWTPKKAILVLRNPNDRPQSFDVDVRPVFELPPHAPVRYLLHTPWQAAKAEPAVEFTAGQPKRIDLKPFEVLTLETVSKTGQVHSHHLRQN